MCLYTKLSCFFYYLQHERPCCISIYKLELAEGENCIADTTRTRMLFYLAPPQGQGHYNSVSQLLWVLITYPPCQLSLWEETRVPGENSRLSAER